MHRLLAVALPPLPEVRPGDDLPGLIAAAWRLAMVDEPELTPASGDVLVVTQKVVSKAEGAVVDLRTVTPRPEAVAFADAGTAIRARSRWCCGRLRPSCAWSAA